MAVVYATLADGGWRNSPIAITKVVFPDGHVDNNWGTPHRVRALSEAVTGAETSILQQNVQSGTAARSAINCPTAAKTGTTSKLIDAWLDGYTPRYSTVVWMGYPNRRVEMTDVHGEPQQGGYLPAEIWHDLHGGRHRRQAVRPLPAADRSALTTSPFFGKYSVGRAAKPQLRIPQPGEEPSQETYKPGPRTNRLLRRKPDEAPATAPPAPPALQAARPPATRSPPRPRRGQSHGRRPRRRLSRRSRALVVWAHHKRTMELVRARERHRRAEWNGVWRRRTRSNSRVR